MLELNALHCVFCVISDPQITSKKNYNLMEASVISGKIRS